MLPPIQQKYYHICIYSNINVVIHSVLYTAICAIIQHLIPPVDAATLDYLSYIALIYYLTLYFGRVVCGDVNTMQESKNLSTISNVFS